MELFQNYSWARQKHAVAQSIGHNSTAGDRVYGRW